MRPFRIILFTLAISLVSGFTISAQTCNGQLGGNATPCVGTSASYFIFNGNCSYTFSNADVLPVTGRTVSGTSITWTAPGTYTINFKCSGCLLPKTVTVLAATTDPGTISVSPSATVCPGASNVTITSSKSSIVRWERKLQGESNWTNIAYTGSTLPSQHINTTVAGSYRALINGNCGSTAYSPTADITLTTFNPYQMGGGGTYCHNNLNITLSLNGSQTGITYYLVRPNGTDFGSQGGTGGPISWNTVTPSDGSGTYRVRAVNSAGCSSLMSSGALVTFHAAPVSTYAVSASAGSYCAGQPLPTINLSGSQGSDVTYKLYRNGTYANISKPGNNAALSFNITQPGIYTVQGVRSSCQEVVMSGSATVTMNALPAAPSFGATSQFCGFARIAKSANEESWYWLPGPTTFVETDNSMEKTISTSGTVYLGAKSVQGCWNVVSTNVTVSATNPTVNISSSGSNTCNGESVTLTASGNAQYYIWHDQAGNVMHESPSFITPPLYETSQFKVSGYSATGCVTDKTITITGLQSVSHVPGKPVLLKQGNDYQIKPSETVPAPNGITYYWQTTPAGTSTTPAATPLTVTSPGIYYLRPRNTDGCWGRAVSIEVPDLTSPVYDVAINSTNVNYVRTYNFQKPGLTLANADNLALDQVSVTTQYLDGLVRPMQIVGKKMTPDQKDLVEPIDYDRFGRVNRKFLSYASTTSTGDVQPSPFASQRTYYTSASKVAHSSLPLSYVDFDDSPLNRATSQLSPGENWVGTTGLANEKSIQSQFSVNSLEDVIYRFEYNGALVNQGTYAVGALARAVTIDENKNDVIEFSNKTGQTIMKRVKAPVVGWAETYYVYDRFGNLVVVLPPQLVKIIKDKSGTKTATNTEMNNLAFIYTYDDRNRMVEKKVPGAEAVFMVYDPLDRLVMTQDGNQRALSPAQWTFTKYDVLGRPVITGRHVLAGSRTTVQNAVNTYYTGLPHATKERFETYKGAAGAIAGYDNKSYPVAPAESAYYTVTYYDKRDAYNSPASFAYTIEPGFNDPETGTAQTPKPDVDAVALRGQVVATLVKNLHTGTWMRTVNHYDTRGRLVQSVGEHQKGLLRATSIYDFTGRVLITLRNYTVNGLTTIVRENPAYDAAGRLIWIKHFTRTDPDATGSESIIVKNDYNQLGQLVDKKLHSTSTDGAGALQSIDYRYNIRGWLTRINESNLAIEEGDPKDFFGMNLAYEQDFADLAATEKNFNGNISAIKWSTNLGLGTVKEMGYDFQYDVMNRLTSATHKKSQAAGSWTAGEFDENGLTYDLNGNILSLNRRGEHGLAVDQLTYNYGDVGSATYSNRLLYVRDLVTVDSLKVKGFNDNNAGANTDYTYDANGNLTRDLNKGIGTTLTDNTNKITYNYLNLPETVAKGGNSIRYVYDAGGRKLAQITSYGTFEKRTDYIGDLVFENDVLQFVNHPEGRAVMAQPVLVYTNGAGSTGDIAAVNTSLSVVKQNGEKYVKGVSVSSGSPTGMFPIGGSFPVEAGQKYLIRAKGYRTGSSAAYLRIKVNGNDIGWPGSKLPEGLASESWVEQLVTIPANGAYLQAGVCWNGVTGSQNMFLNEFEIVKLTTGAPEYQYHIKDHLGNVRLTFTSKSETDESLATFEEVNAANEQSEFIYYDEAVRVNAPLFDHTGQLGSDPGVYFYRGINLNGPATTIDGNNWVAAASATNFSVSGYSSFENQSVPLVPATDANRASMLRSSVWGNVTLNVTNVPSGTYDIYLYVWEDNAPEVYNVSIEGVQRLSDYNSGSAGMWTRLGPFRTSINDGSIDLFASGVCNISGLEVWTVSQQPTNQAPVVTNYLTDQSAMEAQAFTFQFPGHTFLDPDIGATLTYSANQSSGSALPSWLTFNSGSRTFSGTPPVGSFGFYDIRVTASDGNGGTVSDVFMLSVTQTATSNFYRGINLNGPAITIDGNSWQSGNSNPNFSYSNHIGVFEDTSVPLIPSTDANRTTMIRSSIWGLNPTVVASAIPNGVYDVFLYVWEDNFSETFSVALEGSVVVSNYVSGAAGTWSKLGPFRVSIADGDINISTSGGAANLSGIEIRSISTTNVAVTGISIPTSGTEVLVGKSVQVARTISPSNATNRSVTWSSSNTSVATVNNDGWVTGVSPGTATLTVSLAGFSAQTTVTVKKIPSSYSTRLTGTEHEKYGLAKSISVMPGDVITTEVYAKYVDSNPSNWNAVLTNLMATIANGTAPGGTLVDGGAAGSIGGGTFPFIGVLPRDGDSGTGPKAYLNYIVFDRNYKFKRGGFRRLTTSAKETGTDVPHERLAFDGADKITVTEPGYVYIYLSNENDSPVEVYFDDFKVTHVKSAVVSGQEYYPFGLTFNSYSRENSAKQDYLYNGKEIQDELNLGILDYGPRFYMPDIGRFNKPDIFSGMSSSYSPYGYAENDPVSATDLGGNFKFPAEFRQQFPKVTAYLEKTLPLLQYNERIINSLNKHTNLDKDAIKKDLQNGNGPEITGRDFEVPHWGNNSVIGRLDINQEGLLQQMENGLATDDPKYRDFTDIYTFMTIVTILHEYVHEASKRTRYRLPRGWGNDGHDEGSNWEYDAFGRYIDYPTQRMAQDYAKHPEKAIQNTVQSYMQADPSMGIFIVIYSPASNESKEKKTASPYHPRKFKQDW